MFENLILGPFIALDGSRPRSEHVDEMLDRAVIPVVLIQDKNHEIFERFSHVQDFEAVEIFVTIQYKKPYE